LWPLIVKVLEGPATEIKHAVH